MYPVIEMNNVTHMDTQNNILIATLIKKHVLRLGDLHRAPYLTGLLPLPHTLRYIILICQAIWRLHGESEIALPWWYAMRFKWISFIIEVSLLWTSIPLSVQPPSAIVPWSLENLITGPEKNDLNQMDYPQ